MGSGPIEKTGGGNAAASQYAYPSLTAQTITQAKVPTGRAVRAILIGGGGAGGANNTGGESHNAGGGGGGGYYLDVTIPANVWATITAVNVGSDTGGSVNLNGGDCELKAGSVTLLKAGKGANGVAGNLNPGAGGAEGDAFVDPSIFVNFHKTGLAGSSGINNGNGGAGGLAGGSHGPAGIGGHAAVGGDGSRGSGGGGGGSDESNHSGGAGGRAYLLVVF